MFLRYLTLGLAEDLCYGTIAYVDGMEVPESGTRWDAAAAVQYGLLPIFWFGLAWMPILVPYRWEIGMGVTLLLLAMPFDSLAVIEWMYMINSRVQSRRMQGPLKSERNRIRPMLMLLWLMSGPRLTMLAGVFVVSLGWGKLPWWSLFVISLAIGSVWAWYFLRLLVTLRLASRRQRAFRCPRCDYSVRGTEMCTECGLVCGSGDL